MNAAPIQTYHLPGTIRNNLLNNHDVRRSQVTRLASCLRTEQLR